MPTRELYMGNDSADTSVTLEAEQLTTHAVVVGMTGSGKTGLSVVMLEELLKHGVPLLVIDPKGDMGNLALAFEQMSTGDFEPWVPEGADAQQTAAQWKAGVEAAGWDQVARRNYLLGHEFNMVTPGSTAGTPLNILGSFEPPVGTDTESLVAEVGALSSGLLRLIGEEGDPLSDPNFILLANLIERAWSAGETLSMADLISQIQTPPLRKLGVFDLDTFCPAPLRMKLALRINALVANPAFASWLSGEPLNVSSLLWGDQGRPRVSVLYLSHLSEEQRQFVVSTVLSRVVSWMQSQPGSQQLRALVYMDEVFGFAPPTSNPPSKQPILTLLKQARAYGVGLVLATQNPVDLDYKAMSNAGTWLIGRLQTERDKARILEALQSASGDVDLKALDARLGRLGKREFLLHQSGRSAPRFFSTRWALSYLRGPITKAEIGRLIEARNGGAHSSAANLSNDAGPQHGTADTESAGAGAGSPAPESLASDEVSTAPQAASGTPTTFLSPAAAWASELNVRFSQPRWQAALACRVSLHFDERSPAISHDEEWEAVVFPLTSRLQRENVHEVDYDARDLCAGPPEGARFVLPEVPLDRAATFRDLEKQLKELLYHEERIQLNYHPKLKLCSRPGETPVGFAQRCEGAAAERAEEELQKLHGKVAKKHKALQSKRKRLDAKIEQAEAAAQSAKRQELVSGASSILGMLFGGSRSKRSVASKMMSGAGGFARRRARSSGAALRAETAIEQLEQLEHEVEELEASAADEAIEIEERWQELAAQVELKEVTLEKNDIRVQELALLWLPEPS